MAKELLPRFITSQEVDPLLGSTRTRERWERAGLLPPGELVSGYRSAVKVFPDFAVARLAAPQSLERSRTLQRGLAQLARGLYRGEVFNELRAALKEALAPKRAMGVAELVSALLPTHRELLELFAANIRGVEQALRELDVDVTVSLARVVRRERDLYVVELVTGGEREVGSGAASPSHRFKSGQWAMLEEARVRGFRREFLLPTAVLDDALAEAAIRASQEPVSGTRELLRGALADRPAPIDDLTRGREPIDMRDELRAGRVGAINTEPILSPVSEAEVSGLTYSEPEHYFEPGAVAESFRAWCARRFSRVPLPDDFNLVVGGSLDRAWKRGDRAVDARAQAMYPWRVLMAREGDGIDTSFLIPFDEGAASKDEVQRLVDELIADARERLTAQHSWARRRYGDRVDIRTFTISGAEARPSAEVSLRALMLFPPLALEHVTYPGDEVVGVEPRSEQLM